MGARGRERVRAETYRPAGVRRHAGGQDAGAAVRRHAAVCRDETEK